MPRLIAQTAKLGSHDEALAWLERACADLSIRGDCYPQYEYAFEPLRGPSRSVAILRSLSRP